MPSHERTRSIHVLSQSTLHHGTSTRPVTAQTAVSGQRRAGAPSVDFDDKRIRRMFRAVAAGVPWKDIPTAVKEVATDSNPDGFTPGLSTCRKYWYKAVNMLPSNVTKIGDKDIQRKRDLRTLEKLKSVQLESKIPTIPPIEFQGSDICLSLLYEGQHSAQNAKVNSPAKVAHPPRASKSTSFPAPNLTFRSSSNSLSSPQAPIPSVVTFSQQANDALRNPSPRRVPEYQASSENPAVIDKVDESPPPSHLSKRPYPYGDDGEETSRPGRKMFSHATSSSTQDSLLGNSRIKTATEQCAKATVVEISTRRERTLEDLERDMQVPPGFSATWRDTLDSSKFGTWSTARTTRSRASSVPDASDVMPDQDVLSARSSVWLSVVSIFQQLDRDMSSDEEIARSLRSLLQTAGLSARKLANGRDEKQRLPLEVAISHGYHATCLTLLDFGADVERLTSDDISLSKFTRKAWKASKSDSSRYCAIGICYRIITTYYKPHKTRDAILTKQQVRTQPLYHTCTTSSFVNPRPAPLPPTSQHLYLPGPEESSVTPSDLIGHGRQRHPPVLKPTVNGQREHVPDLVKHFDNLRSNRGSLSSRSQSFDHGQFGSNENLTTLSQSKMSPINANEVNNNKKNNSQSFAVSSEYVQLQDNEPSVVGDYIIRTDGRVFMVFPAEGMAPADVMNASKPVLHKEAGVRNTWVAETAFESLPPQNPNSVQRIMPLSRRSSSAINSQGNIPIYEDHFEELARFAFDFNFDHESRPAFFDTVQSAPSLVTIHDPDAYNRGSSSVLADQIHGMWPSPDIANYALLQGPEPGHDSGGGYFENLD